MTDAPHRLRIGGQNFVRVLTPDQIQGLFGEALRITTELCTQYELDADSPLGLALFTCTQQALCNFVPEGQGIVPNNVGVMQPIPRT